MFLADWCIDCQSELTWKKVVVGYQLPKVEVKHIHLQEVRGVSFDELEYLLFFCYFALGKKKKL